MERIEKQSSLKISEDVIATIAKLTSNPVTVEPAALDWKTSMGGTAVDYFSSIDTDIEGGRRAQVLQKLREYYGQDRVANVVTFGTEGSKSAIQTAARGLGIDNDISLYISSLIPADRGKLRTLAQCYYGDEENDFEPIPLFVQAMNLRLKEDISLQSWYLPLINSDNQHYLLR